MSSARRACVLLVMAGLVPAVQAEDMPASAKPATAGTAPAKTAAPRSPATPANEPAAAAKPAAVPEADDELLEFLGSVDSDTGDQDWIDYLSQTDIAKVAKGKKDD